MVAVRPTVTLDPRPSGPAPGDEPAGHDADRRALIIVLLLSAAVAINVGIQLGSKSLWIDETYTWSTVARSWGGFVSVVRHSESQNLLYALLLFGWNRVGDSEAMLRFPSAVFAVLTVPSMYLAGRALCNRRVGILAAVLFAVNANSVQYGQEARAYMLAMLFGALSIAGFAMIVRAPSRRATLLWVVSSSLLVYTHPYALFLVSAELVSLLVCRPVDGIWRRLRTGTIVIAAIALPAVLLLISQRSSTLNPQFPSLVLALRYVTGVFGKFGPSLIVAWAVLLAYGLLRTVRVWPGASRTRRWQLAAVWCLPVVTLGLVCASDLYLGLFSSAHVVTILPTLVLAGAVSLNEIRSTRVFSASLAVIVVLSLAGVVKWHVAEPKADWRDATAYVLAHASRGDVVVFADDQSRIPFEYYARRDPRVDQLVPGFPAAPWGHWGTGDQKGVLPTAAYLGQLDQHPTHIWVVADITPPGVPGYPERALSNLYHLLDRTLVAHHRGATIVFPAYVDVFRYDPSR